MMREATNHESKKSRVMSLINCRLLTALATHSFPLHSFRSVLDVRVQGLIQLAFMHLSNQFNDRSLTFQNIKSGLAVLPQVLVEFLALHFGQASSELGRHALLCV